MGDPLGQRAFDAFGEELVKEAVPWGNIAKTVATKAVHPVGLVGRRTAGFGEGLQQAVKRLTHPIEGTRSGYAQMSPAHRIATSTQEMGFKSAPEAVKALTTRVQHAKAALEAAEKGGRKETIQAAKRALGEANKQLGKVEFGGAHLRAPSQTLAEAWKTPGLRAKSRAVAEELSRRGVTGQGGPGMILRGRSGELTKYLPVGEKGQVALLGGMGIPGVVNAQQASPTGEGGTLERAGSVLGGLGGMAMGGGLGFVPAVGTWLAGEYAGGRLGRILDRFRSGGTMGQTFLAPSPEQAQSQLERIQKYYG